MIQFDKLLDKIKSLWYSEEAKIRYSIEGRYGHVQYSNKGTSFSLYFEFGGGDCIASINIPSQTEWEKQTGLPNSSREGVLHFIGSQVAKDQVSMSQGYYKIEGNFINIYS